MVDNGQARVEMEVDQRAGMQLRKEAHRIIHIEVATK